MNINLTLLMQAAAFAAFIWFTAKFVWPPLMRAIDARQKQIADGLAAGEQGRQSLANTREADRGHDGGSQGRSSEIVAQGEKLKSETIDAAKAQAKAEADRILAGAKAEIEQEIAARQGSAAQPGRRSCRGGRVEDPEARGRRQGARRSPRRDPAAALTAHDGRTDDDRPALRGSGVPDRAGGERAAGVVGDAALSGRHRVRPAGRRGAGQPEAHRRRQGGAAAVHRRRQARRRPAATSSACWSRPTASRCCRRSGCCSRR